MGSKGAFISNDLRGILPAWIRKRVEHREVEIDRLRLASAAKNVGRN